jgi:hypothetical protein
MMNLIFRFILWLIRLLAVVIFFLIIRLMEAAFRFVLFPLFMAVLRVFRGLIFLSFRATVNGPTRFIDRRAGEWTQMIVDSVDDRAHIHEIYQLCRFVVGTMIVLGWIVSGIFTVTLLRVVFGFFT